MAAFRAALPGSAGSAGAARLEATSDFFLVGGDSLSAAQLAESLGVAPGVVARFRTPRSLARALAQDGAPAPPLEATPTTEETAAPGDPWGLTTLAEFELELPRASDDNTAPRDKAPRPWEWELAVHSCGRHSVRALPSAGATPDPPPSSRPSVAAGTVMEHDSPEGAGTRLIPAALVKRKLATDSVGRAAVVVCVCAACRITSALQPHLPWSLAVSMPMSSASLYYE